MAKINAGGGREDDVAQSGGDTQGVIFQCPTCRALVPLSQAERGEADDTIALRCPECRATTELPLVATSAAKPSVTPLKASSPLTPLPTPTALTPAKEPEPTPNDAPTEPVDTSLEDSAPETKPVAAIPNVLSEAPKETSKRQQRISDAMEAAGPPAEGDASLVEELAALASTWDDVDAHKRLVRRAGIENKLSTLGPYYRAVLNAVPDDDTTPIAQQEILSQAMARMQMVPSNASRGLQPGNTAGKIAMVVIASLIAVAIWIMVGTMRSL